MSVLASLDDFPAAFRDGLIGADHLGLYGYTVTCIQVRELDSIIFLNAANNVIGSVPYNDNSIWTRTVWSDDGYDTDMRSRDPARVGLTLYLVTPADLAAADEAAELQAAIDAVAASELAAAGGGLSRLGGMQNMNSMQSLLDATYIDLIIAGVQGVSSGVELTIGLPAEWTHRLDVLVSDDLGPFLWRWIARLDDATNGVSFTWVDTNAPTIDRAFYLLGNADRDSDGDGIPDAVEIFVDKTSPTNPDTDGDGIDDGVEIANRTDPNNPDTIAPVVTLYLPPNGGVYTVMP